MHTLIWSSVRPLLQSLFSPTHPCLPKCTAEIRSFVLQATAITEALGVIRIGERLCCVVYIKTHKKPGLIVPADQWTLAAACRPSRDRGGTQDKRGSADNNYPYLFLPQKNTLSETISLHRYKKPAFLQQSFQGKGKIINTKKASWGQFSYAIRSDAFFSEQFHCNMSTK